MVDTFGAVDSWLIQPNHHPARPRCDLRGCNCVWSVFPLSRYLHGIDHRRCIPVEPLPLGRNGARLDSGRSDYPPLAVLGLAVDTIVASPDSAAGLGILCIVDHPILLDEEDRFGTVSPWPLDWVDFHAGRLDEGVFDPVDWLFLPVDGFSHMRATGPEVRLATVGLPLAAPVPDVRSYFALRHRIMEAVDAVRETRWHEAQALYDTLFTSPYVMAELITESMHVELLTAAGMTHFQFGNPAQALTLWQRCVDLRPTDAMAHSSVGSALGALHRYDEALVHLERAAELSPRNVDLLYNLGALYLRLARFADGADVLERAAVMRPEADTYSNLGWALLRLGRLGDAERSFRAALDLQPDHAQANRGRREIDGRSL